MKYMLLAVAIVAVAIPVLIIFSCGGSGLPTAPACPSPTPLSVASVPAGTLPGQDAFQAYSEAVSGGIKHLVDLRNAFRKQYPTDTFFRDSAFRPDFATYADDSTCTAQQLIATQPPPVNGQVTPVDNPKLTTALNSFIAAMKDGRDAVASRNVTKYRQWYATIGDKLEAVNTAFINPSASSREVQ